MQGHPRCCMLVCICLACMHMPCYGPSSTSYKHPTCWKSANLRLMRFLKKRSHHICISYHNPECLCISMLNFIKWITQYNDWFCTVTDFVEIIWFNTLTDDSSVFRVVTVMNTKWITATVHKFGLLPSTDHIVQKNGSSSLAKVGTRPGNCTCWDECTFKPTK